MGVRELLLLGKQNRGQQALGRFFRSGHALFNLFPSVAFKERAPRWASRVAEHYPLIFGLSPFAHLFVCSQDETKFAVIVTDRPELVPLKSANMSEFVDDFLRNQSVLDDFFRRLDFEALVMRLGPLDVEECFYPVPYPALGGSGRLETFQKGNAWVHLEILGQSLGL